MASCFGVTLFFFSIWIMKPTILGTSISTDCRSVGVKLIRASEQKLRFSFSEAQAKCGQLGLPLASKLQVENAHKHGYETCSYGWIKEGYLVIPRIMANVKCGQNKTGVVTWNAGHDTKRDAYCYNSSDVCEPEKASKPTDLSKTESPDTSTEMNSTSTVSYQDTSETAQAYESPQAKEHPKVRKICVTETILPTEPTTEMQNTLATANRVAFRNDGVIFGGVPTALLVLALIFFVATTVLGVCYIKKYKKTFPFSKKEEKKEVIETKDIKEAKPSSKTPEAEPKNNGKKAEEPQAKSEPPVRCLEAEV